VIDLTTNQCVSGIALPRKPELAVGDERANVFVNLEDVVKVVRIDVRAIDRTSLDAFGSNSNGTLRVVPLFRVWWHTRLCVKP
jgi:hypothetical protein